jgi:hypothetical protein
MTTTTIHGSGFRKRNDNIVLYLKGFSTCVLNGDGDNAEHPPDIIIIIMVKTNPGG